MSKARDLIVEPEDVLDVVPPEERLGLGVRALCPLVKTTGCEARGGARVDVDRMRCCTRRGRIGRRPGCGPVDRTGTVRRYGDEGS